MNDLSRLRRFGYYANYFSRLLKILRRCANIKLTKVQVSSALVSVSSRLVTVCVSFTASEPKDSGPPRSAVLSRKGFVGDSPSAAPDIREPD